MMPENNTNAGLGLPSPETLKRSRWLFWCAMVVFVIATGLISVWMLSHDTVAEVKTMQDQLATAKS
jgi:UPF0716 family protein affecting phage T7 exclusion